MSSLDALKYAKLKSGTLVKVLSEVADSYVLDFKNLGLPVFLAIQPVSNITLGDPIVEEVTGYLRTRYLLNDSNFNITVVNSALFNNPNDQNIVMGPGDVVEYFLADGKVNVLGFTGNQQFKTINGQTILGTGDITIEAGGAIPSFNVNTASSNLLDIHLNGEVIASNTGAIQNLVITDSLNASAEIGDKISVIWYGAAQPVVQVTGVQLINNTVAPISIASRYQGIVITKADNNNWIITGAV